MEKIAKVKDLKRGESKDFKYKGKEAILIKTMEDKFVAFSKVCPYERGIEEKNSFLIEPKKENLSSAC